MKYTICNMCENKMYEGQTIFATYRESFCSEDCLYRALGIIEHILTEDDCEEGDAE